MYQHQFIDPSQTNINYLDLSLMGSSGTSNNNSSCFEADPSSLFRMLQPSINFNDVGSYLNENMSISGTVSPTSAAVYYDPNTGFNYSLIPNNGIDINGHEHLLEFKGEGIDTYGGEVNENIMVKSGGKKRKNSGKGGVKNEKDRRLRLSKQYEVLKTVIPNPTKPDRATIVQDTIDHIHELLRTMDELKLLIEQKRVRKISMNRPEMINDTSGDNESSCMKPVHALKGTLRSSWLQRKSKYTHVDVRIVEDEVFIKLTQHKKIDCLMIIARVFDELVLDLVHMSGGNIGDLHVFMFNTKIQEGSSVYAGAIAKKIIEAMDANYPELFVSF